MTNHLLALNIPSSSKAPNNWVVSFLAVKVGSLLGVAVKCKRFPNNFIFCNCRHHHIYSNIVYSIPIRTCFACNLFITYADRTLMRAQDSLHKSILAAKAILHLLYTQYFW